MWLEHYGQMKQLLSSCWPPHEHSVEHFASCCQGVCTWITRSAGSTGGQRICRITTAIHYSLKKTEVRGVSSENGRGGIGEVVLKCGTGKKRELTLRWNSAMAVTGHSQAGACPQSSPICSNSFAEKKNGRHRQELSVMMQVYSWEKITDQSKGPKQWY